MAPQPKRPSAQLAVIAILAAVLVLLAVLQYRWSLEVSNAERARMKASLDQSISQFRQEFYRELAQVCSALHSEPAAEPGSIWASYAERYQSWARTAPRPDLVANVFVWQAGADTNSHLLLLRPALSRFEPVEMPASLAGLLARLEDYTRGPLHPPGPDAHLFAWTLDDQIPALVHPVLRLPVPPWRRGEVPPEPPRILGFVVVELNRQVLEQHLLGDLAQRYFGGPEGFTYNVAVVSGERSGKIIYQSDPQLTREAFAAPDARAPLLGPRSEDYRGGGGGESFTGPRTGRGGRGMLRPMLRNRAVIIVPSPAAERWLLLVRHRAGSLESVVAADRRRNLFLSFGVLLLLAASMAMILVSTQKARRLAHLQMEFVAGVSHELRTPVAVICSAADNLAEGFVGAREQVKEYGSLIRNEGRRLAAMIEQILHFAASQAGGARYDLQPVEISGVIDGALANVAALPEAEGFTVERQADPDLPAVMADPAALTRCLQNLILNALKYGGESRWVRLCARKTGADPAPGVRVTVEDRGMGIDAADLPHIFEPFYRGKAAQAAQIHGAGLGLNLARDIAEGMRGHLTATSERGRGSTFTLDLPAATQTEAMPRTA
jgi:signal transduction histidine kinase